MVIGHLGWWSLTGHRWSWVVTTQRSLVILSGSSPLTTQWSSVILGHSSLLTIQWSLVILGGSSPWTLSVDHPMVIGHLGDLLSGLRVLVTQSFGHSGFWSLRVLVTHCCGHLSLWSLRVLVTQGFGHSEFWSLRVLVTQGFGHSGFWSLRVVVTYCCGHSLLWSLCAVVTPGCDHSELWSLRALVTRGFGHSGFWSLRAAVTHGRGHSVPAECPKTSMDIAFLVDGSGSIGHQDFLTMKSFIAEVMRRFRRDDAQFSLTQFSSTMNDHFDFSDFRKNPDPEFLLRDVRQLRGTTHTATAILHVLDRVFVSGRGARPAARRILVVVTDGEKYGDDREFSDVVPLAEAMAVTRYAIGVRPPHLVISPGRPCPPIHGDLSTHGHLTCPSTSSCPPIHGHLATY
uniref:VWFA domain-containing protein n=1 Tax=Cyanoderma ruficeps TaxID=181631 RepID=A0A8C3QR14_9PASS